MALMFNITKPAQLLILICFIQISYSLPVSDIASNGLIRPRRDVNILQDKLIQTLNPKPILDTATSAEKCCNTQQHPIGKKVLTVIEQITGAAANAIQIPKQTVNQVSSGVTDFLNQIGAKLVGLQK